jgi:hypothetical protein
MRLRSWAVLSAAAICVLSSCSSRLGTQQGGGSQNGSGPLVVATPIGHKATSKAGTDPVAITVRSGADVLLSGKDTQSRGSPVTNFSWTQATTDVSRVTLLYRTSNTVDFTAPTVATPTLLNFTLTAQDSSGASAAAHVAVTVVPASDTSQFLTTPLTNPTQQTFQVAVVPLNGLSHLQADAPVCITLDRTIHYTNRNHLPASVTLARRASDQVDAAWLQSAGAVGASASTSGPPNVSAGVASYTNPRATFSVPSLDEDDLFALYNQPPQPQIAQQLVAADIDSASLAITIGATPGKCGSAVSADPSNPLIVSIVNSTAALVTADPSSPPPDPSSLGALAAPGTLALSLDDLRQAVNGTSDCATPAAGTSRCTETAKSAALYYNTIDPIGSAPRANQTMNAWLDANCFNSGAANFGADTHAAYTNNFDLGFGRDMYFVTCTASNLSKASMDAGRVAGDSASIVINYPSLESVVLKQNPIIAVAMSHNAYSGNTASRLPGRITKFFVFAPDDRDGGFYLVRSANFDHRGQKYVPGACTGCHGGTVNAANIASGDLDSAFMPWDESALLFADTDPSYTGVTVPKTGYTEADQAAAIYALNQHAYATYLNSSQASQGRFAAPEALIQKWYGGGLAAAPSPSNQGNYTYTDVSFKSQKFDESGFPLSSVDPGSSWANESAANGDDVYHNVFAHECRSCHTQLHTAPAGSAGAPYPVADQFNTYDDFKSEFISGAHGMASLVLGENVMPLARLTADRLWVNFNGGKSAATILANRIQTDAATSGLIDSSGNAVPAGSPQITPAPADGSASRFDQVRVDASPSLFMASYQWTLCLIPANGPGTPDPNGTCGPLDDLVSGTSAVPAFGTAKAGIYELSLGAGSRASTGQPLTTQPVYRFSVARTYPQAPSCTLNVTVGHPGSMSLSSCQSLPGNPLIQGDNPPGATDVMSLGSWSPASKGYVASCYQTSIVGSCNDSQTVYFSNLNTVGSSTLTYQLCDTADATGCASGQIMVNVTAAPVAPTAASTAYYITLAPEQVSNGVPVASQGTLAQNIAPPDNLPLASQFQYPSNGIVSIPVDAATCSGTPAMQTPTPPTTSAAASLAYAYGVTPCTDSFTLSFSGLTAVSSTVTLPTPGGGNGPTGSLTFSSTGQHSIAVAFATSFPACDYTGTLASANMSTTPQACTPAAQVGYGVTDAVSHLAATGSPTVTVNFVETQSWRPTGISAYHSVYENLQSNCNSGCHSASGTYSSYWNLAADAASSLPTLISNSSGATNCNLGPPHVPNACIVPGAPDMSQLVTNACGNSHFGTPFADQACANLRQWIKEGANLY